MIVYLHGFASSSQTSKVAQLKEIFGEDHVTAPDLPENPAEVEALIKQIIIKYISNARNLGAEYENKPLIFVGTSLGAFYASYFASKYDSCGVIINPSVNPSATLARNLGRNVNYVTGEEFTLTLTHLNELTKMRNYMDECYNGSFIHLYLAKDDEVIPYTEALSWYKHTASTVVKETGGHRFTEHWNEVIEKLKEIHI